MKHTGSCHCGDVAFEVDGDLKELLACNCSICQRKGSLLWFVPRDKFTLKTPESALSTYEFNKHLIHHRFCKRCGIHPFAFGTDPKGNKMAAVNARCLTGPEGKSLDLGSLKVQQFDGRSL